MKILEAFATLAVEREAGRIELPRCPLPNGLDLGVEFVVALCLATDRLHGCKTVEDLLNGAIRAGTDFVHGLFDPADLDRAMIRVCGMIEDTGER